MSAGGLEILNLHAQGGMAEVYRARATDESGAMQTDAALWNPSGYLHNSVENVTIEVAT